MFQQVTQENLQIAAQIHASAWRKSHKDICSEAFIQAHTTQRQMKYIQDEMKRGRTFYLLTLDTPKGIVSVCGNLIENLYVVPSEQRKGYGGMLLGHAQMLCAGNPVLWVLSSNTDAQRFYQRNGYVFTGNRKELKNSLYELKMTCIMKKA